MFSRDNPNPEDRSSFDSAANGNDTIKFRKASPVSIIFFSPTNVNAVQEGIRYRVWVESGGGHVIGRQSEMELTIVMRSIYQQYARNSPYDVVGQVRQLNAQVLDFCVPRVLSEIGMYMRYRKDISQMPVPLARAPIATTKGSRTLPGNPHLFK
jgi:hypothetical protein